MKKFVELVHKISEKAEIIPCIACIAMMAIAVANCILRKFGFPILATYDIVCLLFILVVALALPGCETKKGNIYLELLMDKMPQMVQYVVKIITDALCCVFCGVSAYGLMNRTFRFMQTGQTGLSLQVQVWPFVLLETIAILLLCVVFFSNIIETVLNIKILKKGESK